MLTYPLQFSSAQESHEHSLLTLNALYQYDDFMISIDTLIDIGCGFEGLDLEWWATRTTREDTPQPLEIKCMGMDNQTKLSIVRKYPNLTFCNHDFEQPFRENKEFDVIWCHDAFQYAINPFSTLKIFRDMMSEGGMLCLILPQTTNIVYNRQEFVQLSHTYYHYTLPSLIHLLAINGFDCKSGFFLKLMDDPWLHAIVYKSDIEPLDPRTTSLYELAEMDLLPDSVKDSILKSGRIRQPDLVLPWITKSLVDYSRY